MQYFTIVAEVTNGCKRYVPHHGISLLWGAIIFLWPYKMPNDRKVTCIQYEDAIDYLKTKARRSNRFRAKNQIGRVDNYPSIRLPY